MHFNPLFSFLLLLISNLLLGQNVTITGSAPKYLGQSATLIQTDDFISNERSVLLTSPIGKDGEFQFSFKPSETKQVIIAIGQIEAILYVEPDKTYSIEFPPFQPTDYKRFDKNEVALIFHELPENDLNILIRAFNRDYAKFIDDHYFEFAAEMYTGSETFQVQQAQSGKKTDLIPPSKTAKESEKINDAVDSSSVIDIQVAEVNQLVEAFEQEVNQKYQRFYSNVFFQTFVRYSLAELFLVSGYDKKKIYADYFMSQKVQHHNPAFMKFFHVFYNQLLTNQPKVKQDEIYRSVNASNSAMALLELFKTDSLLLSEPLREIALVKGLKDVYYNDRFVRGGVLRTLLSLEQNATTKEAREAAERVHLKYTRCKAGWEVEDFTLLDADNEKWTFSEHTGKYTYILFFAQWSASCMKELQTLQKWEEQYNKDVQFVAISMDSNYDQFTSYLHKNRQQKFIFLFGGGDPLLREKFDLMTVPTAVLIDPEGKIMADYTRLPTGGIQMDFAKIVAKKSKGNSEGTWKEK
jgi:peroxiredoxin